MYLNTELKMNGKNAFRRNYWPCVGATLVVSLLTGGGTSVASNASDVSSLATNTFSGSTSATDHIMSIPTGLAGMAVSILGVVAILETASLSRTEIQRRQSEQFLTDSSLAII